MDEARY